MHLEDVLIPLFLFSFLAAMGYMRHQRKMLELRLSRGASVDDGLATELQQLKQQIAELRDTTTRYDMSFDSALQRIESRMGHVEQRVTMLEREGETAPASRG